MAILAIDQGTSSSRVFIFNKQGQIIAQSQKEFPQYFPKPGWVEHDPMEIWDSVLCCIKESLAATSLSISDLKAIAITNQRETTVIWDKKSGAPIYNAIVWQSRQTEELCQELKNKGLEQQVRQKTGLVIDAYFSGPKIQWILNLDEKFQRQAENNELCFGTVDSWLLWKLSGDKCHATDISNASRTMLYDIHKKQWDPQLLKAMNIPQQMLPEVKASSGIFTHTNHPVFKDEAIPICGIAGDQQAALYGQQCLSQGDIKNTYGTGCFMLMNTGDKAVESNNGLITTIAWEIDGKITYALEGSVFVAGSVIQWLRDKLKIITNTKDSDAMAKKASSNEGVYMVPSFVGLGAPYWQSHVRGSIFGLTRDSDECHLVRAALESIAYQTKDLLSCMEKDIGQNCTSLKVDGGASLNHFLMQFQADLLGIPLHKPRLSESTVLGAALLAAKAINYWSPQTIEKLHISEASFTPVELNFKDMQKNYAQWQKAVDACIHYSS